MKIIAHRGASARAPENTLASIRLALALGADGVEVDVHLARDAQLAVLHDADTRRIAPGQPVLRAAASTLDELQSLEVGSWKGAGFFGERIPALDDVLALLPAPCEIFIELKSQEIPGVPGALDRLFAPPAAGGFPAERAVVMSFHATLALEVKRRRPEWRVLLLLNERPSPPQIEAVLDAVRARSLDGIGQNRKWALAPGEYAALREAGAILSVWTVNDPAEARVWRERGFDYLTTDAPDTMR